MTMGTNEASCLGGYGPYPGRLASTVPGLLVRFDPESIHELIEAAEQVHDRHQFKDTFVVKPELPRRGSVHVESIDAAVDRRDGHGNDLLRERVELAWRHHDLGLYPVRLQMVWLDRHDPVKIRHKICAQRGLNVLVDFLHLAGGLIF